MSNNTTADVTEVSDTLQIYYKVNGAVALTEFTVGASLNLVCFSYFLNRSLKGGTSAVNALFLAISFVDICMCTNMLFSGISGMNNGAAMCFRSKFLCNLWGLIWHTGQGLSIFLVALLAFARWRCMAKPLKTITRRTVLVAILAYTVFQIFKSTLNYWYMQKSYAYNEMFLGCTVSNINTKRLSAVDKVVYFVLYICEVLLPAIPIIVFSIKTMICLRKTSSTLSALMQDKKVWAKKREAAVTMLILAGAYLFFNVFYWFFLIGDAIFVYSGGKIRYHEEVWGTHKGSMNARIYYMTYYGIYIHAVVFNSTANALIYILRLADLRNFVKGQYVELVRKVKRLCRMSRGYDRVGSCRSNFDKSPNFNSTRTLSSRIWSYGGSQRTRSKLYSDSTL